ncbi:uncharacterized protein PRCAT00001862001 [Priceomyces carsonii]|uniref:uncharacterized protein n=1 Tax=Priceomyces carsonii TaxID=28549 RepID=UPI002EDA3584|nr:unnamed protein product [Priceomyces carsonii]
MVVTLKCLADVCLIPIGTGTPSVSNEVALITNLARNSHLKCTLHSAGTTIEGPWNEVTDLIGQMHQLLHKNGVVRIQSDIRIGTRIDKSQSPQDKINVVEEKLKKMNLIQ